MATEKPTQERVLADSIQSLIFAAGIPAGVSFTPNRFDDRLREQAISKPIQTWRTATIGPTM